MPRIVSENELKFNLFKEGETLKKNKYGIDELMNEDYISPKVLNNMFIPFVGIDKNGHRLGYGGGFFDRTIEELRKKRNLKTILAAFEIQKTNYNFQESFDQKVDYICSEQKIYSL